MRFNHVDNWFFMKMTLKSRKSLTLLKGLLIHVFPNLLPINFEILMNKLNQAKNVLRIFSFLSLPSSASLYKLYFFKIMQSPDFRNCILSLVIYLSRVSYLSYFFRLKEHLHSTKLLIIIMV